MILMIIIIIVHMRELYGLGMCVCISVLSHIFLLSKCNGEDCSESLNANHLIFVYTYIHTVMYMYMYAMQCLSLCVRSSLSVLLCSACHCV